MTQTGRERRPAPPSVPVALPFGDDPNHASGDLARVRELLAGQTPVVAMLSGEYAVALHPMTLAEAIDRLEALGFTTVETTVLGEEMVAAAYEQQLGRPRSGVPSLRSTCPVAVDRVRHFHPGLVQALVALVPPYIAQARLIRALNADGVRIVYVAPCTARKAEAADPTLAADVDAVIGFDELRTLLAASPVPRRSSGRLRRPRAIKQLSAIDGFPVRVLRDNDLTQVDVVTVRGLPRLDELLDAIERGETCPAIVDMLACEGCISGPCVNDDLSLFEKKRIATAESAHEAPPVVDSRTFLSAIPAVELRRTFRPDPRPRQDAPDERIGPIDTRTTDRRLAEEVARATRYDLALSVVLVDVDLMGEINDRHGRETGDALLGGLEVLLDSQLRACDAVVRFGEDEFLLILPNTCKTDAWAVAEKTRAAVSSLVLSAADGRGVSATASMGVASRGDDLSTASALLEAAREALGRAKLSGRDRVELAAG